MCANTIYPRGLKARKEPLTFDMNLEIGTRNMGTWYKTGSVKKSGWCGGIKESDRFVFETCNTCLVVSFSSFARVSAGHESQAYTYATSFYRFTT